MHPQSSPWPLSTPNLFLPLCSTEGVNSQQLLPRCRFWNSHLCNNKPQGKRW